MSSEAVAESGVAGLAGLCKAETWSMGVGKVLERPTRMEAIFYGSDGYQALEAMRHSGFVMDQVSDLADVIWPGVFARRFVEDPAHGVPFLSTSVMMEARPKPKSYLSLHNTRNLPAYLVDEGTILVSRSGTVGNVVLVTEDLSGSAVSEDALRVHVRNPVDLGLAYCFLQSALGQFLLKRSQTGSVVRHIYEADVAGLPIPKLPLALRQELTDRIRKASALRVEANRLLDVAERSVYVLNGIEFSEGISHAACETMCVSSPDLMVRYEAKTYHRLEATYRNRSSLGAIEQVKSTGRYRRLINSVSRIPFTGPGSLPGVNKVDPEYGTPAITARDLRKARPAPSYYLASRKRHLLDQMMPVPGTTLVMCAGTLGATDYVRGNYDGWAVSLDVIRVVPDPSIVHPGYVYAFLSSELGQAQVRQQRYGSVIPRIHSRQIAEMLIAIPASGSTEVGEAIDYAFDQRALALSVENEAIALFLAALALGREATESRWSQ